MTKRKPPAQGRLLDVDTPAATARVRRYVDRQLRAQRNLGQLEPVDDGLVGVAMTMADVLDAEVVNPDRSPFVIVTGLAKLVPVLIALRGGEHGRAGEDADVELAALVATVRDAARPDPPDRGDVTLAHLTRLRRAVPYEWQWDVAEVTGELHESGVGWRYPVVVLSVPRRAGKTTLEPGDEPRASRQHSRRPVLVHGATP